MTGTTKRAAHLPAIAILVALAACNGRGATTESAFPPPTAPAGASTAATASAAVDADGVAIDPSWVSEDRRLMAVFRAAGPACTASEQFVRDATRRHEYQMWVPSIETSDLEQRFRDAATGLGYAVEPRPAGGLAFRDEEKHVSGHVDRGVVTIVIGRSDDPPERIAELVAQAKMETWALVNALGERESWSITFERKSGAGATFYATLVIPEAKRATIDAWARDRRLKFDDGASWFRKIRPEVPQATEILISLTGSVLIVTERTVPWTPGSTSPACRVHPLRRQPAGPDIAVPQVFDDRAWGK